MDAAGELINERADVFTKDVMKRLMAQQIAVCCMMLLLQLGSSIVCNSLLRLFQTDVSNNIWANGLFTGVISLMGTRKKKKKKSH